MGGVAAVTVDIPVGDVVLEGNLHVPAGAIGLVVFSHGSGRLSPRNNAVAAVLREHGFGTLLPDLLTRRESEDLTNQSDIPMLTSRLVAVTDWVADRPAVGGLPLGYFGISTGAAVALKAALRRPDRIAAVVSHGGRVDLIEESVTDLRTPCLLLVGDAETAVLEWNRDVVARLPCESELSIVRGPDPPLGGSGRFETVAERAAEWFETHL